MAKIYLESFDNNYTISNNRTTIYGTSLFDDSILIEFGVKDITVASTIEKVHLSGEISDFTFEQGFGSNLEIQDLNDNRIVDWTDINNKVLSFDSSVVTLSYINNKILVDGAEINSNQTTVPPSNIDLTLYSHTNNGLGILSNINSEGVRSLDSGYDWGTDVSLLTYSFNEILPPEYMDEDKLTTGFTPLNQEQREVVRSVTKEIDSLLDLRFQEVEGGGDIRFSIVDMDYAGFAFFPDNSLLGGDIFLSSEYNNSNTPYDLNIEQGRVGWSTIIHEIGHALGLKHPFEEEIRLSAEQDNTAHTIMSYSDINNYHINFIPSANGSLYIDYISISPQLYSLYDVSALQDNYGVNSSTNTANNTYTINFDDFKFQTIWDAGGEDTFDFSQNRGDTTLDLQGGTLNSVDEYTVNQVVEYHQNSVANAAFDSQVEGLINDLNRENKLYTGKNNLGIANGVIIENVNTGMGNDKVIDNEVDNIIDTSAGNDTIYVGRGGFDSVNGGEGDDTLYVNLLLSDIEIQEYESGYLIYSDNYAVKFENIEHIVFADDANYTPDALIV